MITKGYIFIGLIMLSLYSMKCQEAQILDAKGPQIPVYSLSGIIRDIDSDERLPELILKLEPVNLLYQSTYTVAFDTTNNQGYFYFPMLVPGNYLLKIDRNHHTVCEYKVYLTRSHKTVKIAVAKPLVTFDEKYAYFPEQPHFSGFYWKYSGTLIGITDWEENFKTNARIYEGNFVKGFKPVGKEPIILHNNSITGLAYLDNYWTCRAKKIYSISPKTGQIETSTSIPHTILDLTVAETYIWASTQERKILKFNRFPSQLVQVYRPGIVEMGGIAWDGKNIWISDLANFHLIQFDHHLNKKRTYKLFYVDPWYQSHLIEALNYISFDYEGHLWIGNENALFEFIIP